MQWKPAALAAWLALATAFEAALAQAPHAIPPPVRPLRERAALADVIAIVEVVGVAEGRIRVVTRGALRGAPPATFEVKRSPLRPPPLAAGDRALLVLRGARPPYVLVDVPDEVLKLHSDAQERALREGLQRLLDTEGAGVERSLSALRFRSSSGAAP